MNHSDFLTPLLKEKSIVICCGAGGVGKTTTSAVLGLRAAMQGKKVLVLTIDPARRLANSLGLDELGNQITQIKSDHLAKSKIDLQGEMYAMMLDSKRTFDALVKQFAPNPKQAEDILNNQFYQHISKAMTGSHEYMAMEKLYEIHSQGDFDVIVLDTPPTYNALDFLNAPKKVTSFLDDSVIRWFLKPYFAAGKFSLKGVKAGGKIIYKILESVTGLDVLKDISEFFLAFQGMYDGFRNRADHVHAMLRQKDTAFVLVTSPNQVTIHEAAFFYNKLKELSFPIEGAIINRVHKGIEGDFSTIANFLEGEFQDFSEGLEDDLRDRLIQNAKDFHALFEMDQKTIVEFFQETKLKEEQCIQVPYMHEDIFDLTQLKKMLELMFPSQDTSSKSSVKTEVSNAQQASGS